MQTNANSAAFPRPYQEHVDKRGSREVITIGAAGLTKREAFAAQILAGIIAADSDTNHGLAVDLFPGHAVRYADALLAELEKRPA